MCGVPVNHISTSKLGANCEIFRVNSEYRTILQTALLWCGASTDELPEYEKMCFSTGKRDINKVIYGVYDNPRASECLKKKTEAIARGINEGKLRVSINGDSDSYREDLWNKDWDTVRIKGEEFKAFLQEHYPNETPKNFFDEVEISTRKKITLESYQLLQAENNNLKRINQNLERRLEEETLKYSDIEKENNRLKLQADTEELNHKTKATLYGIIGALKAILLDTQGTQYKKSFNSQNQMISYLLENFPDQPISKTSLENVFADINKTISK